MSSSPTAATSTTGSSNNSPSDLDLAPPHTPPPLSANRGELGLPTRAEAPVARDWGSSAGVGAATSTARTALVACGALAQPAAEIAARRGWTLDVYPLNPLLHNQPHTIAAHVRPLVARLQGEYPRVVIGYADCGTYGALDIVCADLGVERLPGLHCYDVFAGPQRLAQFFEDQPGTYVLTDFLVRSFARTVVRELGLDRWPELREDYFGSYTRVVWLAQQPDDDLRALAEQAADTIGLPLTIVDTGHTGLERALSTLVG